jgi:hypothetical protein
MKNIQEIQSKLSKFQNSNEIDQLLNAVPEATELKNDEKAILQNVLTVFIGKLMKHLASKKPTKSSISNLFNRSLYRLQHNGLRYEAQQCYCSVIEKIINENFNGAFSNRLNVKSKEFLNLEDCEPF